MIKGKFGIVGGRELERALDALDKKLRAKIARKAVREAAKPVQAAAKASAPVKSGLLKNSIVIRTQKKRSEIRAVVTTSDKKYLAIRGKKEGVSKRELFYAHFYEFGTQHQPARPFMRPVFDRNRKNAADVMMSVLRQEIAREGSKK